MFKWKPKQSNNLHARFRPLSDLTTLRFTTQYEWINAANNREASIGISEFAQKQLGDVMFVDLPKVGRQLKQGESFGIIESAKATSDLYAPCSGKIVAVNTSVESQPSLINRAPFDAWLIKISLDNDAELSQLLTHDAYKKQCDDANAENV